MVNIYSEVVRTLAANEMLCGGNVDVLGEPVFAGEAEAGDVFEELVTMADRGRCGARVAYLGMIGSRRKRDLIGGSLLGEGLAVEELSRVHSPIGISIGAETPEEIAVSIVAELIQIRARAHADRRPAVEIR